MCLQRQSSFVDLALDFDSRSCPLCGEDSGRVLFRDVNRREGLPASGTLVQCRDCGMHYVDTVPDAASLAQIYGSAWLDPVSVELTGIQPVSRTRPAASFLRLLAHCVNGLLRGHPHDWPEGDGRGRSILDFGCHDGTKLIYWYQRGWQVAGIDVNEQGIEVARRRFANGRFWCGDLPELNIRMRFDFIRADNVLEHLPDPVPYLAALGRLLKPGGWLRVFVPNGAASSARLLGRYSYVYWMPFHLNLFTVDTLHVAFARAGFQNIKCFTFSPIEAWSSSLRQLLLRPGFNRRPASFADRVLRRLSLLNYPGETIAQWLGMGEEVICSGQRSTDDHE